MGISITCGQCAATLRVKDELAGKRGKCPKCQSVIQIPGAAVSPASSNVTQPHSNVSVSRVPTAGQATIAAPPSQPSARPATQSKAAPKAAPTSSVKPPEESRAAITADILGSFQGFVAPISASPAYRLGMVLTLLVMFLMLALYIGLIVALAAFLCWYLLRGVSALTSAHHAGDVALALAAYPVPLLAVGIWLLFMVKPLFARRTPDPAERELTREDEPLLFEFVERISAALGAPKPARIKVDCDANASASFSSGLWSPMTNDLTLTIGLPLIAGLPLQQFAGVVAHELGHFAQGGAMRLTWMVRWIGIWFVLLIFERDVWDQRLAVWTQRDHWRLGFVARGAQLLVNCTRMILFGLMVFGRAVCSGMLRQMEYNADLHEIRFAGTGAFISTQRAIGFLNVGHQAAIGILSNWSRDKRLADNLPLLAVLRMRELPPDTRKKIIEVFDTRKTGFFDTHPADKDRVAQAEKEQATGVFQCVRPATDLMSDFRTLCRRSTLDFYQGYNKIKLDLEHLQDTEELLGKQNVENETARVASRYFQEAVRALRPFVPPSVKAPQPGRPELERLTDLRSKIAAAREQYEEMVHEYDGLLVRSTEAFVKQTALEAGFSVGAEHAEIVERRQEIETELKELSRKLAPFESGIGHRLLIAVNLLSQQQVVEKIPEAPELAEHAANMVAVVRLIDSKLDDLRKIRDGSAAANFLLGHLEIGRESRQFLYVLGERLHKMYTLLKPLLGQFEQYDYPLEQGSVRMPVSQYLLWQLPNQEDLIEAAGAAVTFMENAITLKYRIVIALGEIGERVESAIGLPPLEEIPKPSSDGPVL